MGVDEELSRAGRELVSRSAAAQTPEGLRRLDRRRRTTRTAIPVAAAMLAAVMLWAGGDAGESSIDAVDQPTSSTGDVDESQVRIESGRGPTTVVTADGSTLVTFDGEDLVPGEDDLALAVMSELLGTGTGAGSSAAAALAAAGLRELPNDAVAQLADAGLVITTTIDAEAQEAASAAVEAAALPAGLTAALWSIDPDDGSTLAVSGPGAVIRLPAGGAVRPAMMAGVLEAGVTAEERLANPAALTVAIEGTGTSWEVANIGGQATDPVTMGEALAMSANTPWAGLFADGRTGEAVYADVADRFGFEGLVPALPSTVLGVFDTDLVEVVRMTAVFASDGSRPDVHLIERIETTDDGVLFDRSRSGVPESEPVVSVATRDAVRAAMADAVCCGTATRSQLAGDVEQIGSSGSVQGMPNSWFTGSTPAVTTVVWVGGMEPTTERIDPPLTGNGTPAEIWADYTGSVAANDQSGFPR